MATYDTVHPSLPNLPDFDRGRGGSKNEAVDDVNAAVDHRKSTAANFKVDPPRQIGHPGPRAGHAFHLMLFGRALQIEISDAPSPEGGHVVAVRWLCRFEKIHYVLGQ
jgi:hypothetical protein